MVHVEKRFRKIHKIMGIVFDKFVEYFKYAGHLVANENHCNYKGIRYDLQFM